MRIDPNSVASLLKMWIRERITYIFNLVPECILTNALLPKFRLVFSELSGEMLPFGEYLTGDSDHPVASNPFIIEQLKKIIVYLPDENYTLLSVFLPHLSRVAKNFKINKMGYTNLNTVWAPTLNFGSAILITMIVQSEILFPVMRIQPYKECVG